MKRFNGTHVWHDQEKCISFCPIPPLTHTHTNSCLPHLPSSSLLLTPPPHTHTHTHTIPYPSSKCSTHRQLATGSKRNSLLQQLQLTWPVRSSPCCWPPRLCTCWRPPHSTALLKTRLKKKKKKTSMTNSLQTSSESDQLITQGLYLNTQVHYKLHLKVTNWLPKGFISTHKLITNFIRKRPTDYPRALSQHTSWLHCEAVVHFSNCTQSRQVCCADCAEADGNCQN